MGNPKGARAEPAEAFEAVAVVATAWRVWGWDL
jgi:hypothetical protein